MCGKGREFKDTMVDGLFLGRSSADNSDGSFRGWVKDLKESGRVLEQLLRRMGEGTPQHFETTTC